MRCETYIAEIDGDSGDIGGGEGRVRDYKKIDGFKILTLIVLAISHNKMEAAGRASVSALFGREMGILYKPTKSIHDLPVIPPEKCGLKGSIFHPKVLVIRKVPLPYYQIERIRDLESKIERLKNDFKFLSFSELDRFFYFDIQELKQCFVRISRHRSGVRLSKEQIISGIELRAQEEFPDDPNYVEVQTRKLDEIFSSLQEDLTYETNKLLREIDLLEEI